MKRFLQKSYSWLATLLLTVAFAVSGSAVAQGIELPFAFSTSSGGTVDGVGFYMWSANWVDSAELYGEGDASATWGTINLTSPAKNIVKVELTCRTNSWSGVSSAAAAAATVCETEDLGGSFTTNGAVAIWQGSAHKLTFSSSDDIDVYKMVVYLEEGEVVKECTVGVDHYADNCKPGKHETPFSRYITLYMQENAATTTWTGNDNCPAGVTLTNEAGQQFPISQFNTWRGSDQLGVQFEKEIATPGVYTLHIPEGLVAFESGKFNKEINVTWTIVEPDLRPTKEFVFDFADGTYTNDGTLSYTKDGITLVLNENRYNATAQGFRIATDGWLTFTAPEKATIKHIQLLQESSYGVSPDFIANVGEISVYDKTLNWSGDDATVTLTDHYGTCYFTKAIVTLAVEETDDELCFEAWKAAINKDFANIAYEYDYQTPSADIAGKKPAAVAAPCVKYWLDRSGMAQMGLNYNAVASLLAENYNTTVSADYAYGQELLAAYNAAEVVPEEGPEVVVPSIDINELAGEWYFIGQGAYCDYVENTDGSLTPKDVYATNITVENGNISLTGLVGYVYDGDNAFIGTYNAAEGTLSFNTPYEGGYIVDNNYEYYLMNGPLVFNVEKDAAGKIRLVNNGWDFYYEDWNYIRHNCGYSSCVMSRELELPEVEPSEELLPFEGDYLFVGTNPTSLNPDYAAEEYYDCNISVYGNELRLTGFLGELQNEKMPYLIGKYDSDAQRIKFSSPSASGDFTKGTNGVSYLLDYFYVYVTEDEDGALVLDHPTNFVFYAYDGDYTKCTFDSFQLVKDGERAVEPAGWNGNVLYSETASTMDDLLSFTIEFEEAKTVKATAQDVLGAIFDPAGNPYAIVLANGEFNVFGDVKFKGSKATVEFVKIADLNADLQASAKAAASRIGGFSQTPGAATVVFTRNSFIVDGVSLGETLVHEYTFAGEGEPTGIDSIATSGNDAIYDLSGRRVKTAGSGLYIKNGVKVYMK